MIVIYREIKQNLVPLFKDFIVEWNRKKKKMKSILGISDSTKSLSIVALHTDSIFLRIIMVSTQKEKTIHTHTQV